MEKQSNADEFNFLTCAEDLIRNKEDFAALAITAEQHAHWHRIHLRGALIHWAAMHGTELRVDFPPEGSDLYSLVAMPKGASHQDDQPGAFSAFVTETLQAHQGQLSAQGVCTIQAQPLQALVIEQNLRAMELNSLTTQDFIRDTILPSVGARSGSIRL